VVTSEVNRNMSLSVIKQGALTGILVLLIALLLSACATSGDEATSSQSDPQSTGTVPGEKISDERFAPGAPGSAGNVRW
jgi:hypothetical protein